MFDRIAGVYDAMNTADDRRAAPPLAGARRRARRRRPRQPRARRRHRHRRPGDRARARGRPGRRGRRLRLLRADARRARAAKAPALRFEWADALVLPYATDASTPRPSASARATSPTCGSASRRWSRVVRPGRARRDPRDHAAVARAAGELLPRWFDASSPSSASLPALGGARAGRRLDAPTPTATCRARCAASRARASSPPRWTAAGCGGSAGSLTAGGIIAIHVGEVARERAHERERRRERVPAGADPFDAILALGGARCARRWRDVELRPARDHGDRASTRCATVAAGGKRLRPLLVVRRRARQRDAASSLSRAAAAVELIHSATLVHDDVLDDAPLRRGPPHGVRGGGPRRRDADRRPAVLERVRRARASGDDRAAAGALVGVRARSPAAS